METKVFVYTVCVCGVLFLNIGIAVNANLTVGCDDEPKCLRCGAMGCIKCPELIIEGARSCVSECPSGLSAGWSTASDYMGRVCTPGGTAGLSGVALASVIGACVGAILCLIIIVIGLLVVKYKARTRPSRVIEETPERHEFLKELAMLRPQSYYFLAMLNDTRRQIREQHEAGDQTAALSYRPLVCDLAKILILLNRPIETIIIPPHDWKRLYNLAEKLLKRYKRLSTVSQPQVAQLINFLQAPSPIQNIQNNYVSAGSTMSTFKPNGFGSSISLQDFVNPFSDNGFSGNSWQVSPPPVGSANTGSSLWLEDEFFHLGYRPQDEITTEL